MLRRTGRKRRSWRERETPFFTPRYRIPVQLTHTYLKGGGGGEEKDHNLACAKEEREEGWQSVRKLFLKNAFSIHPAGTVAKQKWRGIEKKKRKETKTDTFFSP